MDQIKKLDQRLVFKGSAVAMYKEHIELPNGNIVDWDLIKHCGGAGIVPVLDNGHILMVKQYRNTLNREVLEIPAGKRNEGDEFLDCAMRELHEETGYITTKEHMTHLQNCAAAIGYSDEIIGLYAATHLKKDQQNLDEDEFIDVYEYALDDLIDLIIDGTIQDSKTVCALMIYKEMLERGQIK